MNKEDNPYASPEADLQTFSPRSEEERTRREYLTHEISIKSIGSLYFLGALICGLASFINFSHAKWSSDQFLAAIALLGLSILFIYLGLSIRKFKRWGKIITTLFACIGLLGFPILTIISLYFLYLFYSRKGRMVFSDEYQEIIAATPDVKYRSSILSKILLVFVVIILAIMIAGPALR